MPSTTASTSSRQRAAKRVGFDRTAYSRLLAEFQPRPIRSDKENEAAIALVQRLEEGTTEQQALAEVLTVLVDDYESRHYQLLKGQPHEHLRDLMEEHGHAQADIARLLGSRSQVSEILSGKRHISKAQAKKLAAHYRVPLEVFV